MFRSAEKLASIVAQVTAIQAQIASGKIVPPTVIPPH
jgi:hypothetical protein